MVITFIGFALGPYAIGQLSDGLGDLSVAIRWALVVNVPGALLLLLAARTLAADEGSMQERARAAGEEIELA